MVRNWFLEDRALHWPPDGKGDGEGKLNVCPMAELNCLEDL